MGARQAHDGPGPGNSSWGEKVSVLIGYFDLDFGAS